MMLKFPRLLSLPWVRTALGMALLSGTTAQANRKEPLRWRRLCHTFRPGLQLRDEKAMCQYWPVPGPGLPFDGCFKVSRGQGRFPALRSEPDLPEQIRDIPADQLALVKPALGIVELPATGVPVAGGRPCSRWGGIMPGVGIKAPEEVLSRKDRVPSKVNRHGLAGLRSTYAG